ncbi:MAG: hypothetical protein K6T61_07600, partial [Bryobacteraceae bacterium]|nr:hypothetical protein [Bryobacteraceae bacterium]
IIQSGSFGNPPRAELARIGPERDGVFLRWRDMAQGYYFEGIQLISEYNGRLRVIFERKTGENNDGAALDKRRNYHWSAEIRFLDRQTEGFYDIEAEISGTEETADGRIQDAYKRERWRFVKGKYVLVSSVRQ